MERKRRVRFAKCSCIIINHIDAGRPARRYLHADGTFNEIFASQVSTNLEYPTNIPISSTTYLGTQRYLLSFEQR